MTTPLSEREIIDYFEGGGKIVFIRTEDGVLAGDRECNIQIDDPGWDGTGYEHPAFYRGEQYGASQVLCRIKKILSGEDEGHGIIGDPELEAIRREILSLRDNV